MLVARVDHHLRGFTQLNWAPKERRSTFRMKRTAGPSDLALPIRRGGDAMKDIKRDWRRWRRVERVAAVLITLAMSAAAPTLISLSAG